jgi:tRNA(Ile)-lysidine synthase
VDTLHDVRSFARRHLLWQPQTRVVAAVSGGSDSVALFRILHELHVGGELELTALAHVHHGIRGFEADRDESFCRELADRHQVPFVGVRVDVPGRARASRQSIEVAARHVRQEFFTCVLKERGADLVATGHTADDQAETVLMRLARGTGLRGLGGIAPRRAALIRPLLACAREELRNYLRAVDQPWCEDTTNADLVNRRNLVRHEVLPLLARALNPSITDALTTLADHARVDAAYLDEQARMVAERLFQRHGGALAISAADLASLPLALCRRVVRLGFARLSANPPGPEDVNLVLAVASSGRKRARVGSIRVEHSAGSVVLVRDGRSTDVPGFRFELPIPGVLHAPQAGWMLEAAGPYPLSDRPDACGPEQVTIEAGQLGAALVVRSRRPGDRFRPLGLGGSKKIQDLFVDRKVDRRDRDRVPIVTDQGGRILWVAGHAVAEDVRVTERTNAVVVLKLRRI